MLYYTWYATNVCYTKILLMLYLRVLHAISRYNTKLYWYITVTTRYVFVLLTDN